MVLCDGAIAIFSVIDVKLLCNKVLCDKVLCDRAADGSLGRVHCSLNINTETGRLSARRPNLQNQPALEKDRYQAYYIFWIFLLYKKIYSFSLLFL